MPHETHRIVTMIVRENENHIPRFGVGDLFGDDLSWNRDYACWRRASKQRDANDWDDDFVHLRLLE